MFGRRLTFVLVFIALSYSRISASPSPSPSSNASTAPCASVSADGSDELLNTFAYDLESPPILRFLAALAAAPEKQQKHVFDTVVAAQATAPEQAVEASVSEVCPSLDESDGAARAAYLVVNQWTLRNLADAKRFTAFNEVVATALAALQAGRLSPEQRVTALVPFDGLDVLGSAAPSPSPSATGDCTKLPSKARTRHVVYPSYPPLARSAGTTGTVRIEVALSEDGFVRNARIFSDTFYQHAGADEIKRAATFAAVATTYDPEVRGCRPVRGAYLFEAEFTGR